MTTTSTLEAAARRQIVKLQRAIVDGLEDVKAHDIQVFNTEHLSPLFERVIVATGGSNRQTRALAVSVSAAVRAAGFAKPRVEGEDNGEWIIVDCGAAVCHVMQPQIRQYYRLEEIWGDRPVRVKLGSARPRRVSASEDASVPPAKTPAKTSAKTPAVKRAPAKQAQTGRAGGRAAAQAAPQPGARPGAKKAAPMKKVVVNQSPARQAAAKAGARAGARPAAHRPAKASGRPAARPGTRK